MTEQEWAEQTGNQVSHSDHKKGKLLAVLNGKQTRSGHYRGHDGISLLVEFEDGNSRWVKDTDTQIAESKPAKGKKAVK